MAFHVRFVRFALGFALGVLACSSVVSLAKCADSYWTLELEQVVALDGRLGPEELAAERHRWPAIAVLAEAFPCSYEVGAGYPLTDHPANFELLFGCPDSGDAD